MRRGGQGVRTERAARARAKDLLEDAQRAMAGTAGGGRSDRLMTKEAEGGKYGSLSRDEFHEATGLYAGAARSRDPAVQGLAVPAHDRGIDDAGGDPHAVAGDLPAVFGPVVAQRARAGGKPVRASLQPLCRAAPRATASHAGSGAPALRSGHGGGVHAGRGADPAPGVEDGVLRLPGTPRRGLRRAALRKVLPRRLRLSSPEGERRARQRDVSLERLGVAPSFA